jgi:23S rRNA (cytosine1962-C5)-methyltransferase
MSAELWTAGDWRDFEVLDAGEGMKLERWGQVTLARPDPQVLWPAREPFPWKDWQGWYHRSKEGGGEWESRGKLPEQWQMKWRDLTFKVRPTDFKHTGLFPEQAANWAWMAQRLQARPGAKVLNLFGYTGAATVACAKAGAAVTHVDAARGMVEWCKENAALSGLKDAPIRYLVDDCQKFVEREQRRGVLYDALVLDPPSYGRGKSGETWKLEQHLWPLLQACAQVLVPQPLFVVLNSYTTGLSPLVMAQLLQAMLKGRPGSVSCGELALPIASGGQLPCGTCARFEAPATEA